jgi:iron complex transport system ATP-binding protein
MTDVLDLQDVTIRRGTTTILDGLSWTVREGERWVVLGRNGAGKTTVLQVASGRMHPTSGTADLLGSRLGRVDVFELRPRIGLASAALAERIGEPGDAERRYGTLSEGERKRVQIARALMSDPELLLLDEPAAGLDLGGREELVAALSELAADRRSPVLVLVTHHVEEIPPGFTHLLLLADGRVHAAGPVDEVLTSDNLSAAFGTPLQVEKSEDRWTARGRR